MLIIAALNLPFTATFEADEQQAAAEEQRRGMQEAQSLVNKEQETKEEEVPFDFTTEHEASTTAASANVSAGASVLSDSQEKAKGANSGGATNGATTGTTGTTGSVGTASTASTTASTTAAATAAAPVAPKTVPVTANPTPTSIFGTGTTATKPPTSGSAPAPAPAPHGGLLPPQDVIRRREPHGLHSYVLASSGEPGDMDTQLEKEMLARVAKEERPQRPRAGSTASLRMLAAAAGVPEPQPFNILPSPAANRGLFNALDSAVQHGLLEEYRSVGLMTMSSDSLTEQGRAIVGDALEQVGCHVVHASDAERHGHYTNYCKEFLWPTFHCMTPDIPRSKNYEDRSFGMYLAINQKIADKVVEVYKDGDVVWVHDYHLMLVPQLVREKLPNATIGFFLHVAFPSSEVFRSLAYRAELLSGVLAADLIGFHISEYVQHFKMSLARILAVDITAPTTVLTSDHDATLSQLPLGIDALRLERIIGSDDSDTAVQQHRRVLRRRWPSQLLIAGRDKADPIRGLVQKLKAFDEFLQQNPQWAHKVVLVQICSGGYGDLGIDTIADRINSRYGDIARGVQPVVLLKQDVKYEQYLALLCEANGFVVTCLRDGMNLTCHEYAEANDSSRMGPLILSEFTGSASVLGKAAILVNPWDHEQLVQAFKTCVEMPRWERERKHELLKAAVAKHPAAEWAARQVASIKRAWQDGQSRECVAPNLGVLRQKYLNAKGKRLFVLEPMATGAGAAGSSRRMYYSTRLPLALRELCSDPNNIVYIVSPETPDFMERMFRALPGLGLIAEFGRHVRLAGEETWSHYLQDEPNSEFSLEHRLRPFIAQLQERSVIRATSVHPNTISLEFSVSEEHLGDSRDHSIIGEYLSLVNEQFADQDGVRTKLENNTVSVYRSSLGELRKRTLERLVKHTPDVGLVVLTCQPYSSDCEDQIYEFANELETEKITISVGTHPSLAQCSVEGTNALMNLLHTIRTGESVGGAKTLRRD